jgi:hypothetical protein
MQKGLFLFLVFFFLSAELPAQPQPAEAYAVKVVTNQGRRLSGFLYDVSETDLLLSPDRDLSGYRVLANRLPLSDVRRVIVYVGTKRAGTIEGAVLGGLGLGLLSVQSLRKSPLRSPAVTGISVLLALGGGAAIGSFVGALGSNMGRRGIRISRRAGDVALFRSQLLPFTYTRRLNQGRPEVE